MAHTDTRRLYYRAALKLLALGLALFVLQAMVSGFFSRPGTHTALPVTISLDGYEPGEMRLVQWAGQELLVLRRSAAMDAADEAYEDRLYDPSSRLSVQPRGARNPGRTLVPGFFIAYARGTDLSCPLELVSPGEAAQAGWGGGFVDRCRGSRYDFAGRVYEGQPARRNLEVPAYAVTGRRVLLGGD